MGTFNVHGGHNVKCPGASKYLDEVTEDRKVKNKVIQLLKEDGHIVYDCTDDSGVTAGANLANIVAKCNAHLVDLDISIHLNSDSGVGTGIEVWHHASSSDGYDKAVAVSEKVAAALGIRNRGAKPTLGLYVLNHTNSTAILVECCFVDSLTDKNKWNADKCAAAIVEGILGKEVSNVQGQWVKDSVGWWWQNLDSSYPKSCWKLINNDYYYFNEKGYAVCNQWVDYNGNWYYLQSDCRMAKGWQKLGGIYYYFNENLNAFPIGAMVYSLLVTWKGKKYYLKDNGYMAKNETLKICGREYTFNSSGEVI